MTRKTEIALQKLPYFANLKKQDIRALATKVTYKHLQRGELLYREDDACTGLFLVAAGRIRLFNLSASGRQQVLSVRGPGASFGDPMVFDGGNYSATASALEDAEVLFISRKDFQNFCLEHPEVMFKVMAEVASRVRGLIGIIGDLSFTTVRQRVIAMVLRLTQVNGTPSRKGVHVKLTETHEDLAAKLGTVRELVSRNFRQLESEGYLEVNRRTILVKDLDGLRREQSASR